MLPVKLNLRLNKKGFIVLPPNGGGGQGGGVTMSSSESLHNMRPCMEFSFLNVPQT